MRYNLIYWKKHADSHLFHNMYKKERGKTKNYREQYPCLKGINAPDRGLRCRLERTYRHEKHIMRLKDITQKKTYMFDGCQVFLETAEYMSNTLAVIMFNEDGELYGDVTVNLDHPMQSKQLAFLDENNMPGIGKWIEKNGPGNYTGVRASSGFYVFPLYPLYLK